MKKLVVAVTFAGAAFLVAALCLQFSRPAVNATTLDQADAPVEEFTVGRGPRLVLLPVTLNGKTILFCVDTGAWKTIFDQSLRAELGQALGKTTAATPSGFLEVEMYRCPQASIGSLELASIESVGCHDLTKMRYASGQEIYGVLGMDFLRNYAIELDFDAGKCRLWKSAPRDWAKQQFIPLVYDQSDRPQVTLALPGSRAEHFVIDTGANASTLRSSVFDELADKGDIHSAKSHNGVAMAGTFRAQTGYLSELKLELYSHKNIRLDRDPFSALGIRYLSRYTVRLDFIGAKAYFAAGNRIANPEPTATSGLAILQVKGEKVVYSVEPTGPAAALGIAPGDVIVTVDGRDARECDMVSLHEILTREPGASVAMQLRRNNQAFNVAVQLENRLVSRR